MAKHCFRNTKLEDLHAADRIDDEEARPQEGQSKRPAALSLVRLDLPNQHAVARMILCENGSPRKVFGNYSL
jgi:hypothetical protein